MGDIERIQTYVVDVEELLKLRDNHMKQMRTMKMEAGILNQYSLEGKFDADAEKYLQDQKVVMSQLDEYFRGATRALFTLTGLKSVDEVRNHLTEVKVALSKVGETTARYQEAKEDHVLYEDTDNDELRAALEKDLGVSERVMERAKEYLISLVPKSYSPNTVIATA